MLLQGPCESASPGWLPTLLALGRGGCTVPVPVPHPSTSQPRDAKRLALLGAGLLRADLAAGHMSTCLIYMHDYRGLVQFPCWQSVYCDTSPPTPWVSPARRQVETAPWVSSGGTNPGG